MNIKEIVEQLEKCKFTCEAGPIESCEAFIQLKKMAGKTSKTLKENNKHSRLD